MNVTRFGFFTDLHLAGETPRHRIDNFPKTLIEKLKESYEVVEKRGCSFMVFGGDWFNNHRIFSYDVIAEAMEVVCEAGIPTYSVIGEHDLCGHNIQTYQTSTLAFFVRRCPQMKIIWEPMTIGDVVLYPKHEPDRMEEMTSVLVDDSKYNVLVCHELITCDRAPFDIIDTNTLKLPFDLVLSGDLHSGYVPHHVGDTWYCNPGSIARRSTSDAKRFPQIAIIEVEKGGKPFIELVPLRCAKPGTEVFGESIAEIARSEDFDASQFAKELLEFEAESTDVHELIQMAGKKANLRLEVLRYLSTKKIA